MLKYRRIIVENEIKSEMVPKQLRFAFVSDLHNNCYDDILPLLQNADAVLVNGDLVDRHSRGPGYERALQFLNEVSAKCPVFYSYGNHEQKLHRREEYFKEIKKTPAFILDNDSVDFHGVTIGGLTADLYHHIDTDFLKRFEMQNGFKILLCHHPEIWNRYVRGKKIDLTLCGHAHGGQIQIAGRGLFAPNQGLFPKYTHGFYDEGKMLMSRGLSNNTFVPRINNPCEFHIVTVSPDML